MLGRIRCGGISSETMTSTELFGWVSVAAYVLPCLVAAGLFVWLPVRWFYVRSGIAVFIAWILQVAYTIYVYNPAGIAAGHQQGVHFPENQYDNNTVAAAILAGWLLPLFTVALICAGRRALRFLVAR